MRRVSSRGEDVRKFILERIEKHPSEIAKLTAEHFGITRQGVHKHLTRLVQERAIVPEGAAERVRAYKLASLLDWRHVYPITPELEEHIVWREDISAFLSYLPENILDIWQFCFTEIFNNAIDHSGGTEILVKISKTAINTQIMVADNGIGIFRKVQQACGLLDERHAILELAKGKLTTDPENHTGYGIFFTSRALDSFDILSGGVYWSHQFGVEEDWLLQDEDDPIDGTGVFMKMSNHSSRTFKQVNDKYSTGDNLAFTKTIVPVKLAQYGQEKLVSRSQAKSLLTRVERFSEVIFDFTEVGFIGQAFADEIFRVFARAHPEITLSVHHANKDVRAAIEAARNTDVGQRELFGPPTQI